jgi:hypothetical protein
MMTDTQKSLLRFALVGGVLALSLAGCGDGNYDTYEECRLKELDKLTRAGRELIPEAINVISDYCSDLEAKKNEEKESKKQEPAKIIADPNWKMVVKKETSGERWFIDAGNIETSGSIKTFWMKKLEKGQTVGGEDYQTGKLQIDCSAGTILYLSYDKIINGKSVDRRDGPWTAEDIRPGSGGSDFYNYVCGKK